MDAHELLVNARNGIVRDGFDITYYGSDECGTPRCICGWLAWEAGQRDNLMNPTGVYRDALTALDWVAPVEPYDGRSWTPCVGADSAFDRVETVAFRINNHDDPAPILAWVDDAIAHTAPLPPDLDLTDPVEVVA